MEHMEKRKRNSETAGAAAQGGTPAGSRKHAAEPQGRRMERGAVAPGSAWALVTGAGSGIGRCYALRLGRAPGGDGGRVPRPPPAFLSLSMKINSIFLK